MKHIYKNLKNKERKAITNSKKKEHMKYSVKTIKNRNEGLKVKGFVTIMLNDEFILRHIRLIEGKNGQLFLSMPYRFRVDKNGKRVLNDMFNPTNNDFRKALTDAAIQSLEAGGEIIVNHTESGEDSMPMEIRFRNRPVENTNIQGFVSVVFDNCFVIKSMRFCKNENGSYFLGMPSYRAPEGYKKKYIELCNPVTRNFSETLLELSKEDAEKEINRPDPQ
jgi:DNA-binding cell septation regulator SpoVG